MKCLQCSLDASETNETIGSIKIRVCAEGHRTGKANKSMIKKSENWKQAGEKTQDLVNYVPQPIKNELPLAVNE